MITHCPFSDHELISLTFSMHKIKRGPGFWKMNVNTIRSERFKQAFETFWPGWIKQQDTFGNKRYWWEATKWKIKNLTIQVGKSLKINELFIQKLEKELDVLDSKLNTDDNINRRNELECKIKQYYDDKCTAARVRSRIQSWEEGEKSSKFFFDLERKNAREKEWVKIKCPDGSTSENIDIILKEQVNFYSKLFTSEGWDGQKAAELLTKLESVFITRRKRKLRKGRN